MNCYGLTKAVEPSLPMRLKLIASIGYTVWACATLKNHAHAVVRRHRDNPETIWGRFADASRTALRDAQVAPTDHHVWSLRPYQVYLNTSDDMIRAMDYVKRNPAKEGLAPQTFDFVQKYDGWQPPRVVIAKKTPRK
jgi:REP element-mobilizing transposase RayT